MNSFLTELFQILNKDYQYAVLRNYEKLPVDNDSRDIDILILRCDLKKIRKVLERLTAQTGNYILYQYQDHQFFTFVAGNTTGGFVQLDFQFNFAWLGIDLLDERKVLKKRLFNGKIYHLPPDLTFLPKYLYSRILGAVYPKKYQIVRKIAFAYGGEYLESTLKEISLGGDARYWDRARKWTLRLRSFFSAFCHRPTRAVYFMMEFLTRYVLDLFWRRGLMISFSGPDGCGKTTVIELLRERLAVNPPMLFHFRPSLLPNLGEVAHKAGAVKEVDRNFDRPHRGRRKGLISSLIRLAYYSCDYMIGYVVRLLPLRQRKHIVFFDRYFTDIIVDGERSSIFLNYRFLAWLRHFIPGCQYNFLFRVDPERILNRKQELSGEAIERIYSRLEYLASRDGSYYWIDNNGTPEEAVQQILNILLEQQHRKYAKKLLR